MDNKFNKNKKNNDVYFPPLKKARAAPTFVKKNEKRLKRYLSKKNKMNERKENTENELTKCNNILNLCRRKYFETKKELEKKEARIQELEDLNGELESQNTELEDRNAD
jgi:chromosome segregation ATPase